MAWRTAVSRWVPANGNDQLGQVHHQGRPRRVELGRQRGVGATVQRHAGLVEVTSEGAHQGGDDLDPNVVDHLHHPDGTEALAREVRVGQVQGHHALLQASEQHGVRAANLSDQCLELSASARPRLHLASGERQRSAPQRRIPQVLGATETGRGTFEAGHLDLRVPQVTRLE